MTSEPEINLTIKSKNASCFGLGFSSTNQHEIKINTKNFLH